VNASNLDSEIRSMVRHKRGLNSRTVEIFYTWCTNHTFTGVKLNHNRTQFSMPVIFGSASKGLESVLR